MNIKTRKIVIGAVVIALTVVLGWMPVVFLVPTLFACCAFGMGMSVFASTAFGVVSLIYAVAVPASPVAVAFVGNPWMPIVPRILVGFVAHGFFVVISKIISEKRKWLAVALTAIVGSLTNTLSVGACLLIFEPSVVVKGISVGYLAIMGCIEAVVNAAVVPPVYFMTKKYALGVYSK
ncbi:MAG: hypothetical protein IJD07_03645 [Clostridia bacterium]|nr:hypothetical protein [Clostridia bacterium]